MPGLTQVQDLLPTLLELSGVAPIAQAKFDGISLVSALHGEAPVPERTLIVQYGIPEPFRMTCVMRVAGHDGEVEGSGLFRELGRGQVDNDSVERTLISRVDHRPLDSVRALFDSRLGQSHENRLGEVAGETSTSTSTGIASMPNNEHV